MRSRRLNVANGDEDWCFADSVDDVRVQRFAIEEYPNGVEVSAARRRVDRCFVTKRETPRLSGTFKLICGAAIRSEAIFGFD
jgi:hypothetical protein